jgi:acyl-CoA synthetase (AMP-forming)/AMP-acid ligase II
MLQQLLVEDIGAHNPLYRGVSLVGELVGQTGPGVIAHLTKVPTFCGGWFRTGAVARLDADSYFYIVDRKKDLVIRAASTSTPAQRRRSFYEHPAAWWLPRGSEH